MSMDEKANLARARTLLFTATQLLALARDIELEAEAESSATRLEPSDAVLLELARQIYQARMDRTILPGWADLIGEPAWDMLLYLLIAEHEQRQVSASDACTASGAPNSTALRWLHTLEKRGIVVWESDPDDNRRSFVRISAAGFADLNRYLRHIANGHSAFTLLTPGADAERMPRGAHDGTAKQSAPA
jgi:DNA-binding MarR family transcriptional regulator